MNYQFGAGKLIARPISNGVAGSPIELATLQDVSVEFKVALKKLMGPYRFAVAVADGEGEIPINAKSAAFYANAFNLALGATSTTGGQTAVLDEAATIAAGTYTVANPTGYVTGTSVVWMVANGVSRQLAQVASAPVAGVSYVDAGAGVLNFATGDNGNAIRVTYRTTVSSGGQTLTINNPSQNSTAVFKMALVETSLNRGNGKQSTFILELNQVILPSLKLGFKIGDWTIPDFAMEAFADQNNVIGTAYFVNYDNN